MNITCNHCAHLAANAGEMSDTDFFAYYQFLHKYIAHNEMKFK